MENIEDIFEISNDNSKVDRKKQTNVSNIGIILKVIRDSFFFFLIFLLTNFTLYSDIGNRNFREKLVLVILFSLTLFYAIISNLKNKVLAFFYSIAIFVLILFIIDTRNLGDLHLIILLCVIVTSLIFHFAKKQITDNNEKNKIPIELDLSSFTLIGVLDNIATEEIFIEKRELNIKRGTFNKYKPILENKTINSKNEIVLKYSNKDDLSFSILITKDKQIYINHWKENEIIDLINQSVFEEIKNMC